LSTHVKAGSLLSNFGHGPNINLEVNYSSNANMNVDGLGTGWSWNLTHFNPITNSLITSIGQSFYLQQRSNGQWYPLYHKMHDIHIGGTKAKYFIITYANGLRETLDHQGYETILEQQNGWKAYFTYQPGTHRLQSVSDDTGHKITLLYEKDYVKIISKGSEGQPVSVLLNVKNGELRKLILPLQKSHVGYGMDFSYRGHLLTRISYPTGLTEKFTYNCTDAMKIRTYKNLFTSSLCVITRKRIDPGAGQPVMQETYEYSKTNSNEHNYLGFNAQLTATTSVKKDMLFDAPVSYTYQTQEDNGIFHEIRTYNKYHLLINDQRISDRTGHMLSEIHAFFCHTDQPNSCAHSNFEELPMTYSQPLKITTKVWSENSDTPAATSEIYHYDKQGRMIFHEDAYGRLSKITYCPLKGGTDCPAEPDGWNMGTLTKSVTVYPYSVGSTIITPVVTRNYYRKLPNRKGHGYILILDHQIRQSGTQEITTTRRYYQDKDNSLTYGLLKQDRLIDNIHKPFGLHEIIHDYYYKKSADNRSKTTYSVTELGAGKQRVSSFVTTSLFTNHVLQQIDASGKNTIRYHYDLWDRPVQINMNIGTSFAANSYYQYMISPQRNQVVITAANGLRSKTIFDGAGRPLMHFREALSDSGKVITNHWIPVSKIIYDNYGRIAAKFAYLISASGETEALKTTQEYDDSGRITLVHQPDGEININQYDDSHRCVVSYRQSSGGSYSTITVTHANILYKPTEQWLFPSNSHTFSVPEKLCSDQINKNTSANVKISTMTYDGFGRIVAATDPLGHIVKKEYDVLGRLINITDPKGDKVHNVYDLSGHIIQHWVQPASGGNYLLASAEYNAVDELLWRAGEDGLHTKFTYTK
ncbi:MAG: RHS repeat protein, partial [Endozoicomonadaceae bacterium]|nr:RHS repeat protein [Endozoicomonadaceae bacterium]